VTTLGRLPERFPRVYEAQMTVLLLTCVLVILGPVIEGTLLDLGPMLHTTQIELASQPTQLIGVEPAVVTVSAFDETLAALLPADPPDPDWLVIRREEPEAPPLNLCLVLSCRYSSEL
jgi:hypothetical protein